MDSYSTPKKQNKHIKEWVPSTDKKYRYPKYNDNTFGPRELIVSSEEDNNSQDSDCHGGSANTMMMNEELAELGKSDLTDTARRALLRSIQKKLSNTHEPKLRKLQHEIRQKNSDISV